jgi:baculoviral IAP repeat-containing protein 6
LVLVASQVCLSLLGTWRSGSKAEQWNESSTFLQVSPYSCSARLWMRSCACSWAGVCGVWLQVCVSLQSLIFVADPYFNEPGFESQAGSASASPSSRKYNQ